MYSRRQGLVATVAVVVAVIVSVGGGAAAENVERDVARSRAEHHQPALAQGRLVTAVTEGTLLQTGGWGHTDGHREKQRDLVLSPSHTHKNTNSFRGWTTVLILTKIQNYLINNQSIIIRVHH